MTLGLYAGDRPGAWYAGTGIYSAATGWGSPAHSRWTPPVHSALTPAQGSPERAGCRLATAAPGLWGSFLPGGTKRRSGHC